MNKLFLAALPVIQTIEESGFEAYFVGGCVRDYLLERDIHDVDIATSATPDELKSIFPHTVDVGIEHGTILVLYKGEAFEITTYRTESEYKDFRRPESVKFIRSLKEDLQRRDFTMNAIAMDRNWKIIDPFHGMKALEKRMIETVGDADARFNEDALRLMRAIRFVSQLGFKLHSKTEQAIKAYNYLLEHIAVERISAEMVKLLDGKYKENALHIILTAELFNYFPALFSHEDLLSEVLSLPIKELNEAEMWLLLLYLENVDEPAAMLKKWKLPAKKIKFLSHALKVLKTRQKSEWTSYALYCAGEDIAFTVEKVHRTLQKEKLNDFSYLMKQYKELPITSRKDLVISGTDVLEWTGKKGGPWIKDLFIDLEKAILAKEVLNDKNQIRRWIKSCQLP